MMTVTEEAKTHLASALENANPQSSEQQACFRIVREDDQLSMVLGQEAETDTVVKHDGKPLLAVEEKVASMLDGRTLDIVRNEQGQPVLTVK